MITRELVYEKRCPHWLKSVLDSHRSMVSDVWLLGSVKLIKQINSLVLLSSFCSELLESGHGCYVSSSPISQLENHVRQDAIHIPAANFKWLFGAILVHSVLDFWLFMSDKTFFHFRGESSICNTHNDA
jgi:hypothetical protein